MSSWVTPDTAPATASEPIPVINQRSPQQPTTAARTAVDRGPRRPAGAGVVGA
jgi:hypothetical protein